MKNLPVEIYIKIFSLLTFDIVKIPKLNKYFNNFMVEHGNIVANLILIKCFPSNNYIIDENNAMEILNSLAKYNSSYVINFELCELNDVDLLDEILSDAIKDKDHILINFLIDNGAHVEDDYLKGLIDYFSYDKKKYNELAKMMILNCSK